MITTERIVGRLLILNHINAEEAVILLGGLYGTGDGDEELQGVDEGYYADEPLGEDAYCTCEGNEACGRCCDKEVEEEALDEACSIPGCDCRTVQIPQLIEEWLNEINAKGKASGYSDPNSTLNGPYFVWASNTTTN